MKPCVKLLLSLVLAIGFASQLVAQSGFYFDRDVADDNVSGSTQTNARGDGPFGFLSDPKEVGLGEEAESEVFNPFTGALIAKTYGIAEVEASAADESTLSVDHKHFLSCFASGDDNSESEGVTSASNTISAVIANDDEDQQHALMAITFQFDALNELLWDVDVEVCLYGVPIMYAYGETGWMELDSPFGEHRFRNYPYGNEAHDVYVVAGIPVSVGEEITIKMDSSIGSDIIGDGFFMEILNDSIELDLRPNPNPPPPAPGGGDGDDDGSDLPLGGGNGAGF